MAEHEPSPSVSTLGLSTRVERALLRNRIWSVHQLAALHEEDILHLLPRLGAKALTEIRNTLAGSFQATSEAAERPMLVSSARVEEISGALGELRLSGRTENALARAGISTISELRSLGVEDLMALRGIGAASIAEVERAVGPLRPGWTVAGRIEAALTQLAGLSRTGIDFSQVPATWVHVSPQAQWWLEHWGVTCLGDLLSLGSSLAHLVDPATRISLALALEELVRALGLAAQGTVTSRGQLTSQAHAEASPLPAGSDFAADLEPGLRSPASLDLGLTNEAQRLLHLAEGVDAPGDDPRLEPLRRSVDPTAPGLRELAVSLLRREQDPPDPTHTAERLRDLNAALEGFLLQLLEEELHSLAASGGSTMRGVEITLRHLGWEGGGGANLQQVGDEFGVSRERVRQIQDRVLAPLSGRRPFAPALDRALAFVGEALPATAERLETALSEARISRAPFRLEGLEGAARVFGRPVGFRIERIGSTRVVVPVGDPALERVIGQAAHKAVEHWGTTTVAEVAATISESGVALDLEFLSKVLQALPGFRWLDQQAGWFWMTEVRRNRVLRQVQKILSVCSGAVPVSEIRQGVSRPHRMGAYAPPSRILLELCRQAPGYRVEGDRVMADPPLRWEKVLNRTEGTFMRVLLEFGPVMLREQLEERCVRLGMNRSTFYVHLGYSPVIQRLARGVYALRGARVQPGLVDSLVQGGESRRRRGTVLMDYGWAGGRPWAVYRLSRAVLTSGVFGVPSSLKRFVEGDFELRTTDGTHLGTLVSREAGAWGLGPFFSRRGGEVGDYLRVVWDLKDRRAEVSLGDSSLLDPPGRRESASQ